MSFVCIALDECGSQYEERHSRGAVNHYDKCPLKRPVGATQFAEISERIVSTGSLLSERMGGWLWGVVSMTVLTV